MGGVACKGRLVVREYVVLHSSTSEEGRSTKYSKENKLSAPPALPHLIRAVRRRGRDEGQCVCCLVVVELPVVVVVVSVVLPRHALRYVVRVHKPGRA